MHNPLACVEVAAVDLLDSRLGRPVKIVHLRALSHEGHIEEVAVECHHDVRTRLADEGEEAPEESGLVRLVEGAEDSFVLRFRGVLKRLDVRGHLRAVDDEKPGPIDHDRDQRDAVVGRVRKLERLLRTLDVPCEDPQAGLVQHLGDRCHSALCVPDVVGTRSQLITVYLKPLSAVDLVVDADAIHEVHVVLEEVLDAIHRRLAVLAPGHALEGQVQPLALLFDLLQQVPRCLVHALEAIEG
mmetsp:Transcript_45251/g.130669  ORF Transcript_45251/g.130669 Transcript_45251/m.130669 type:complete len:242 (-) Transcript_45251:490-1215(-)